MLMFAFRSLHAIGDASLASAVVIPILDREHSLSIRKKHESIREKHIFGTDAVVHVVRADNSDPRPWLSDSPISPCLKDHRIAHCGIMHVKHPFEIVREHLSGTFFFACFEGTGLVLVDGEWRSIGPGQACIQPPFIPNAVRAKGKKSWKFCWVRYRTSPGLQPLVSLHAPAYGPFNTAPLRFAIEGFYAEASSDDSQYTQRRWAELIHSYVQSFAQPFRGDERLRDVWQAVEGHLDEDWTLERLAAMGDVSKEHMRRLCSRTMGRTPIQHLTFLRMRSS